MPGRARHRASGRRSDRGAARRAGPAPRGLADREDDDGAVGDARQQGRIGDGQPAGHRARRGGRGRGPAAAAACDGNRGAARGCGARDRSTPPRFSIPESWRASSQVTSPTKPRQADLGVEAEDAGDHGPAQVGVDQGMVACPASARTRARLAATVDLPSPSSALVTTTVRTGLSTSTNRKSARSWRKARPWGRGGRRRCSRPDGGRGPRCRDDGQHRQIDQLFDLVDRVQLAVEVHADERREVAEQDAGEPTEERLRA